MLRRRRMVGKSFLLVEVILLKQGKCWVNDVIFPLPRRRAPYERAERDKAKKVAWGLGASSGVIIVHQ